MKLRLIVICFLSILITGIVFLVAVFLCNKGKIPTTLDEVSNIDLSLIYSYYAINIRGNLFAGLIAVGGFLMTGKTFILVTMKQNVFDDDSYKEVFRKMSKHDNSLSLYGPLIQLKNILYWSVVLTIIAAVAQLSIGLIPHWSASIFSVFISIFSIIMVIDGLNLIKKNLDYWIDN